MGGKVAMNTLQSHLKGSSMQDMISNNFQGSFNQDGRHKHKSNNASGPGGGVKSDPKFA